MIHIYTNNPPPPRVISYQMCMNMKRIYLMDNLFSLLDNNNGVVLNQAKRRKQKDKKKVRYPKLLLTVRRMISIIYNVINRIIENLCNYKNTCNKIWCHTLQISVKTHVQLYTAVTFNSQRRTISCSFDL